MTMRYYHSFCRTFQRRRPFAGGRAGSAELFCNSAAFRIRFAFVHPMAAQRGQWAVGDAAWPRPAASRNIPSHWTRTNLLAGGADFAFCVKSAFSRSERLLLAFIPPDSSWSLSCSATHHSPVPFSILRNSQFFPAPFLPRSASLIAETETAFAPTPGYRRPNHSPAACANHIMSRANK